MGSVSPVTQMTIWQLPQVTRILISLPKKRNVNNVRWQILRWRTLGNQERHLPSARSGVRPPSPSPGMIVGVVVISFWCGRKLCGQPPARGRWRWVRRNTSTNWVHVPGSRKLPSIPLTEFARQKRASDLIQFSDQVMWPTNFFFFHAEEDDGQWTMDRNAQMQILNVRILFTFWTRSVSQS